MHLAVSFIMTQVELIVSTVTSEPWRFNIRAKAYSSATGRELPIFEADNVTFEEGQDKVKQELEPILDSIRKVVELNGEPPHSGLRGHSPGYGGGVSEAP